VPDGWAVAGTTGYEFLNAVNGLFVDPAGEADLTRVYDDFTGVDDPFDEILYRKKYLVLQSSLTGELHALSHDLDRLAQSERWSRDLTLNGLRHALREVLASFPVYRSYVDGGVHPGDKRVIERAVRRARAGNRLLGRAVFDFIRDTLLLRDPPTGPAADEYRAAQKRFAGKFQQLTPPVMAKGCEDTAFYVYNRLVSLNEVGGDPARFGRPPDTVHRFLQDRAARFPRGLSPLATHDTKRGEDVRARLNVLSEIPAEWGRRLARWRELNRSHKTDLGDGDFAPDANDEYLLYQTLVGTHPGSPEEMGDAFRARIVEYMDKAVKEAKVHSSWITQEPEYHAAVARFVEALFDPGRSAEFLADLTAFAATVARTGMINSLAQTLFRCTAPGTPDTYQGTEFWDLTLVDPDNRRPVDYVRRREVLNSFAAGDRDPLARARDLAARMTDGRIKLFTIAKAHRARRDHPDLFATGDYVPVPAAGPAADHVFAFLRTHESQAALVAVPRLVAGPAQPSSPFGLPDWKDTVLRIPGPSPPSWTNVFTGETVRRSEDIPVRAALASFPVALWIGESATSISGPVR